MENAFLTSPTPLHLTLDVVAFRTAADGVFQTGGSYPGETEWEFDNSACCCCCCGVDSSVQAG